jgi:heme/copper-type cytochrome/quinol oxidase subunit 3
MTVPVAIADLPVDLEEKRDADLELPIRTKGNGTPPVIPNLPYGPDDHGHDGEAEPQTPVNNALLGMLLFLGTDLMFFVALIGAFLVFRLGSTDWPPLGQPRLPIAVTGANTAILLASGYTMFRAWRAIRADEQRGLFRALTVTAALGATFLIMQGSEWVRLVGFGLTMSSSVYGAIFYTLIGCHAVHVLGAMIWLFIVMALARQNRFSAKRHVALQLCGMYWFLVVALWPMLYALVYLK